jgi:hypothetical protein
MKIKLLLMAFVFCCSLQSFAQQLPGTSNKNENLSLDSSDKVQDNDDENIVKTKKNGVNLSFGSSGFGFGYARKLSLKLNAMVAYHTIKVEDKEVDISSFIDNNDVAFNGGATSTIIDLGAEYLPFKSSSFKLAFGVGFLNDVSVDGLITYKEAIVYGDVIIAPQDVGRVDIKSTWSGVAPFIGLGFGRAVSDSKFGFSIDAGTYFAQSPEVELTADKLLAPTQDEQANLQDAFESLTFIPRIQLKLTYNF